uniref:Uncharacterized protein n=1 Tax=Meleagris gallopavo TaxID=9103 RepID=A0A803YQG5_MELGA
MSCFPELYFNVDNGYLEGLVRGFKAGVLRQGDYVNLVQCESLEGERGSAGPGGAPGNCPSPVSFGLILLQPLSSLLIGVYKAGVVLCCLLPLVSSS